MMQRMCPMGEGYEKVSLKEEKAWRHEMKHNVLEIKE